MFKKGLTLSPMQPPHYLLLLIFQFFFLHTNKAHVFEGNLNTHQFFIDFTQKLI